MTAVPENIAGEPVAYGAGRLFDLQGRRVVVTGAAHGLCLAVATGFLGAGASVALLDKDAEALEVVAKDMGQVGPVSAHPCDVRDWSAVREAVDSAAAQLGGIDVVVNGSAIFPTAPVAEMDSDTFLDVLDVNVAGYARVFKAAHPFLVTSGRGRVINFSSITFFMGYPPGLGAYVASKGGVLGFTRALAREVGTDGITVNAIAPGAFPTRAEDIVADRAAYDLEVIEKQSVKRRGAVSDIATAAMFLASDASSFITGQTLTVDGGWMFH